MTEPHINPVAVEQSIHELIDRIARGIPIVSNAEARAREAVRRYDVALAEAYLRHDGPAHEKKYAATIATQRVRAEADVAELAYRHAERTSKSLEAQLRAWQSIGASVREMYGAQR
jgi:hypothetical protein